MFIIKGSEIIIADKVGTYMSLTLTKEFNFLSNDSVTRIAGKLDPQQENKNWTTLVDSKCPLKLYLKLCLKTERKVRRNSPPTHKNNT